MKKIALFFVLKDKEWLPKGESISVYEYIPNNPRSPAAFSSVDSKKLNANQRKGQQVYSKWCIACHGEGMPALLEDRTDLSPDLVTIFVRYGKHSMPFFRKTEISDKELQYLGEYLGRNYK